MRICYLGNAANIHIQKRAAFMAGKGHEVHLVSLGGSLSLSNLPRPTGGKIHYHLIKPIPLLGKLNYLLRVPKFARIVAELHPDIVDLQFLTSSGLIGRFIKHRPLVATAWGSDVLVSAKNSKLYAKIVRDICQQADQVIAVAPQITQELHSLGIKPAKIATFPLGVDLARYPRPDFSQAKARPIVLSTRWHEPIYNLDLLIDAVPLVLKACPHALFILVGDGSCRKALEQKVQRLGIAQQVLFLGIVEHRKIADLYTQAQIYVSTSLSDGASESLFESFAGGALPIVTDIPANRYWIEDGINGWLVPTDQPQTLAAKIIAAINSPLLRTRAAELNYATVSSKANLEKNLAQLEEIYLKLQKSQ